MTPLAESTGRRTPGAPFGTRRIGPRFKAAWAMLALEIVVAWSYRVAISPLYAGFGFRSRSVGLLTYVPAFALGLLPALWLPIHSRRPSSHLLWVLAAFVVVPSAAVAPLVPTRPYWQTIGWVAWLVVALAVTSLVQLVKAPAIRHPNLTPQVARAIVMVCSGVILTACVARFGFSTAFVSPTAVTERRLAFRALIGSVSPVFGYLTSWLQSAIAPVMLVVGYVRRSAVAALIGALALVWSYQVTATRQALVAVPFAVALYLAGRRLVPCHRYALFAVALQFVSTVGYQVTNKPIIAGIVGERIFAAPGVIGLAYFDYFAGRPPLLFRDSFGSFFSASPYQGDVPLTIGGRYFNEPEAHANVHVFADAFSKLWLAGILLCLVLALVLLLLDSVTAGMELGPVLAAHVLILLALTNTGLTVTLLTSGWLLALLLLWVGGAALTTRRRFGR